MYDYEYEDEILIFLRFMKFLHIYEPEALKLLIKEHPKVDEDEIYMILDELTLFPCPQFHTFCLYFLVLEEIYPIGIYTLHTFSHFLLF